MSRGKVFQMESLRLLMHEQLTSVGEEISWVVNERLTAVEEFMCNLFQREMETLETLLERQDNLQHHRKRRHIDLNVTEDFLHLPVCKEEMSPEQEERSPSLVQEEPEPPHIKEEQEELLHRPEETDGSMLILPAGKGEGRETEPVASTSTQYMNIQADVEDCGTSQPTRDDQLLSTQCSEDSDEWRPSTLNPLKSHKRLSQDLKISKQTHSTQKKTFMCTVCGKSCHHQGHLNYHMRTHTGEKPYTCTVCGKGFGQSSHLNGHMSIHTRPFPCTLCSKSWSLKSHLKKHMSRTHTRGKP